MISRLILALVTLASFLSFGLMPQGAVEAQVSALPLDFSDVVIFGTNSVRIQHHVQVVAGHVVANTASPGPTLTPGFELDIDKNVVTPAGYAIVGDSINIAQFAVINGNAFYNNLSNAGTINGSLNTPLSLPVFAPLPTFQTAVPGTLDVTVAQNGTQTIAPGNYRDITLAANATLRFSGPGVYNIRSITAAKNCNLLFQNLTSGKADVRVLNQVTTGADCVVGPDDGDPLKAAKIIFYVAYASGPTLTPAAASFGKNTVLKANVYAPNGTVNLNEFMVATGAFLARDVQVDKNVQIDLESFFSQQAPAITSANSATFAPGLPGQTFLVTTTGIPTNTITRSGVLPSGVTFTDNGNNTATIAGTPAAGTQSASPYAWVITASNGVPPNAMQNFTFNVVCPTITVSGTIPDLIKGQAMATATFTQAGGSGAITWSATGLPPGVGINSSSGDVTGTPTANGSYSVTITATDAGGCTGSKNLTVMVKEAPAITSANNVTVAPGVAMAPFTVTTTGFPTNTISRTGPLPSGVTFTDLGNNTASITGTPAAGTQSASPYAWVITASNGVSPNAMQNFTFNVVCPVITVSGTIPALVYNVPMSPVTFMQSGGNPPITWSATGLPNGVSINSASGDVTGTPTVTGTFSVTITATDVGACTGAKSQTVTVAPMATNDAYSGLVDNTQFVITGGTTASPGTPFVGATGTLIANDQPSGGVSATAGTFATSAGGSVTIAGDGTFIYTPKANPGAGRTTSDSFTYTVSSNTGGGGAVTSAPATVNLTLVGRVWYVLNTAGSGGNGQSQAPFNLLSDGIAASTAGATATDTDTIYVYQGDGTTTNLGTASILKNRQSFIGQGVALVVNGNTLVAAGGFPLIGNTVTLANDVVVGGLDVTAGVNSGIAGTSVTGVGVAVRNLTTTTGTALNLNTVGGTVAVVNVTSTGGTAVSINAGTGTVDVTGTVSRTGAAAPAISVTNRTSGTVTFSGGTKTLNTAASPAVSLTNNNGGTVNFTNGGLDITTTAGVGFSASGGGTINVTGANNTINSTAQTALQVVGTSGTHILGTGMTFKSISSSVAAKGVSVQFYDGAFTVTGDGTASLTSGGTISTMTSRGLELISVAGAVSVSGMTFTNAATTNGDTATNCGIDLINNDNTNCNAPIHLQSLGGGTALAKISVNGSAQTGVNALSVRNIVMDTVEVQNVGDAVNEHGVVLKNLLGTGNSITNSDFHNNRSRQLYVINTVDDNPNPTPVLNITKSQFRNSTDLQGALFDAYGSGNLVVNVGDDTAPNANTFSGNFSNGLQQSVGQGGDMTINVKRNTFTNNNSAIVLQAAGVGATSTLSYTIWNNTHTTGPNSGSGAIIVSGTQQHQISGDIRGNLIGNGTVGSGATCGGGCNGITVDHADTSAGGGGRHDVTIVGNTVRNVDAIGIRTLIGRKSKGNVTITGNLVEDPDNAPGTSAAIFVQGGNVAADPACLAATVGGTVNPGVWPSTAANAMNQILGSWDPFGFQSEIFIRRVNTTGGTLNIPGLIGSTNADVVAFVGARNDDPDATGADVTALGQPFGNAATCP